MTRHISMLLAALLLLTALPVSQAFALDVAQAKKEGLVGEKTDGMLGTVFSNPSPEVVALVESTNKARLEIYERMAKEQGITLPQMRTIAAQKILEKEAPGNYIQINGAWTVKRGR